MREMEDNHKEMQRKNKTGNEGRLQSLKLCCSRLWYHCSVPHEWMEQWLVILLCTCPKTKIIWSAAVVQNLCVVNKRRLYSHILRVGSCNCDASGSCCTTQRKTGSHLSRFVAP